MKDKYNTLTRETAKRLKTLREEWELNKHEMADRLGAAYHTYLKYERGVNFPNPLVMEYLLTKCNLSMDWFLFGRGPKHFPDKKEREQLAGEAAQQLETEASQLKQEVADLQNEVTVLKKESAGYLEEAAELKSKLETANKQKDALEKELREGKAARATLPEITEEVKELVAEMNNIPLLRYEILAQFQRFKIGNNPLTGSNKPPGEQEDLQ